MMYSALVLAATAAIASAQVTYDPASGKFICPADNPNGAFCAGDSLSSNIIIRCKDGVGQPGNCNDNLAGFFPFGVQSSPCWQSSPTSGIAACSKNCIVQGGSGTYNGTFTLPDCTPVPEPSASSTSTYPGSPSTTITYGNPTPTSSTYPGSPSTTITYSNPAPPTYSTYPGSPSTTITYINPAPPSYNGSTTITSTGTTTTTCVTGGTTTTSTKTFTTTYCPPTKSTTPPSTYVPPPTYVPSGSPTPSGNTTVPTGGSHTSATATPVGPSVSATSGPALSNSAMTNSAGAGLAAIGLFIAYFL